MGHLDDLLRAMSAFESKLVERWRQTIYDSVRRMESWTPPPVHFRRNYYRSPEVWEYRRPEVQAHLSYGCEALRWFEDGAAGVVPACHGKIRDPGSSANRTVWWEGASLPVDQDQIDCGIPGLFDQVETWSWEDRSYVFNICPLFPQGRLDDLKEARKHLLQMAGDLGGDFSVDGSDPDFQQDITLAEEVDYLFGHRGEEQDWRADWTGTAADRISEGFFSSTKPTLHNHARIANGLATMINERAKIIHTYQKNTIDLIESATAALGQMTDGGETDHTAKWQTVQAIGMAGAIAPPTAFVGAGFILVGWLGEKFLGIEKSGPSYTHHPGEVATNLYESVTRMNEDLDRSEEEYQSDTTVFRQELNSLPSTFLELYDITENSSSGSNDQDYSVEIDTVMDLARRNYGIAERYAGISRDLAETDVANVCLADRNGDATPADTEVIAVIDEFFEYLRTTAARYQRTGEQLEQAAADYVRVDTEQYQVWQRYHAEFEEYDVGDYFKEEQPDSPRDELTIDPEEDAEATDRPDDANDDKAPGFGTDEDPLETDEDTGYLEDLDRVGDHGREPTR